MPGPPTSRVAIEERLSVAAAARTVDYQNWTQDRRGLYYVNWYEKHKECSVRGNLTCAVIARDTFRVHVVWSGIPLYTTPTMDARRPAGGL